MSISLQSNGNIINKNKTMKKKVFIMLLLALVTLSAIGM